MTYVDSNPAPTYRVVGIRQNGGRIEIDDSLSLERANDVHQRLMAAKAFDRVVVEQEAPKMEKDPAPVDNSDAVSHYDFDNTANSSLHQSTYTNSFRLNSARQKSVNAAAA